MRPLSREQVAARVRQEFRPGEYVNLGSGMPSLLSDVASAEASFSLHAENGVLRHGALSGAEERVPDLGNANADYVRPLPGLAFFDSATSFAMVRGGHVDLTVLGAMQVSEEGDLANWMVPERGIGNVGGAMDVVAGVRRVIAMMEHTTREGWPKIVKRCSYPLTGRRVVTRIITTLAVIDVTPNGLWIRERAPGNSVEEIQSATEPTLHLQGPVPEMQF